MTKRASKCINFNHFSKDEEDDEVPTTVKTSFTVKLMKFDEKQKVALIKEVKNLMEGMNLVQVKKIHAITIKSRYFKLYCICRLKSLLKVPLQLLKQTLVKTRRRN